MCSKYTQRSTDVYELPTIRDIKQASHFKDLVSVGPFTPEYLFFFSYRKKIGKTLQTGYSGKESKCVSVALFCLIPDLLNPSMGEPKGNDAILLNTAYGLKISSP